MIKIAAYSLAAALAVYNFIHIKMFFASEFEPFNADNQPVVGIVTWAYLAVSSLAIVGAITGAIRAFLLFKGIQGFFTKILFVMALFGSGISIFGTLIFAREKFYNLEGNSEALTAALGSYQLDVLLVALLVVAFFMPLGLKKSKTDGTLS